MSFITKNIGGGKKANKDIDIRFIFHLRIKS